MPAQRGRLTRSYAISRRQTLMETHFDVVPAESAAPDAFPDELFDLFPAPAPAPQLSASGGSGGIDSGSASEAETACGLSRADAEHVPGPVPMRGFA